MCPEDARTIPGRFFHVSLMLRIIVDRQSNSFAWGTVGVARRDLKFGVHDNGGNDLKSFSEIDL